jgi:sulfatase modifying factor 1
MAFIPGRPFVMGSDEHYPEEKPARIASASAFFIDIYPVTNRQFAKFVEATGHQTGAEKVGSSSVFVRPTPPIDLRAMPIWWHDTVGVDWRHPEGSSAAIIDRLDHPVVHVTKIDAEAYAVWSGKRLPSELEWECAARGGLVDCAYAWGDTFRPDGRDMANIWRGEFPVESLAPNGCPGTSPVGAFPPNGYGAYDMIGNVWEWTSSSAHKSSTARACCSIHDGKVDQFVAKGGSFLCAPNYCRRYRPAARLSQSASQSTSHIGFRCASDAASGR